MSETVHIPVLPNEILELGRAPEVQRWVDGTAGGGGHCRLLADSMPAAGQILAVDRDPLVASKLNEQFTSEGRANMHVRHASYADIPLVLKELGWGGVDGILLDLGLSSDQLASPSRGFSFQTDGLLDMRFDPTEGEAAWEWLARVDEKTLADTIYQYGEERFSRRIAKRIVEQRRTDPVKTADQLRETIYRCVPRGSSAGASSRMPSRGGGGRRQSKIDPATRTFQALRIAVNDELAELERALESLPNFLNDGGRLLIISFHSLEDRIVKYAFRGDERLKIVTKKPVQASPAEEASNPRSRSAKLRVAERLPNLT